jgi:NTP pyrophosphatase (non-canonical NTP hydrolase)
LLERQGRVATQSKDPKAQLRVSLAKAKTLEDWVRLCREYEIVQGFAQLKRPPGVVLMLIVCELAEAMEAWRKNDGDNYAEELTDTLIRLFGHIGECGFDISEELRKKMLYNLLRPSRHGRRA